MIAINSTLELLSIVHIIINLKNFDLPIQSMVVKNLIKSSLLGTDFLDT